MDYGPGLQGRQPVVKFQIVDGPHAIETIAFGRGIRERRRLVRVYGPARWRKCKGIARVRLPDGIIITAELHWYEAQGIGKQEFKIKRILD